MGYNIEQFRDKYRRDVIPRYYSGILHLAFTMLSLGFGATLLFMQVTHPSGAELLLVPGMLLLGELAVFVIHKFPLHRPIRFLSSWTFAIHALQHHRFFTHSHVTWRSTRDFHIVLFPAFAIIGYLMVGVPLLFGSFALLFSRNAGWMAAGTGAVYFMLYEGVHFCSHLPEDHWVMKFPSMRFQREFHRRHHDPRYMATHNFGIVYPLWDYVFGTVLAEEKARSATDPA